MKDAGRSLLLVRTLLAGILSLSLSAPLAKAQFADQLPSTILGATSITSADSETIREFVISRLQIATSDDHAAARAARQQLYNIFTEQNQVSIAFRIEFARITLDRINQMVRGDDVQHAVTGLLLAGKCSTQDFINGPLTAAITDERSAIRTAAAAGLREVILGAGDTALRRALAEQAVDLLARALTNETVPEAAGAMGAALARTLGTQFHAYTAQASAPAQNALANSARQSNAPAAHWTAALQHTTSLQFRRLIDPAAQNTDDFLRAVIQANLRTLAFIADRAFEPEHTLSTQEAQRISELVTAANQASLLATAGILNTSPARPDLADAFQRALAENDPAIFQTALARLVNNIANPVGLNPDDFR